MKKQNNFLASALTNVPHPSFFYINCNNKLCISETDWIDPIDFKLCCSMDSNGKLSIRAQLLLDKIIKVAQLTDNITLSKQVIYKKTNAMFSSVNQLNKALAYLCELGYIYLTSGGVSGRMQLILLNPKAISILESNSL
ncbi:hypothetical protein ACIQXI_14255 [Lysinibacillus sp. NPDC097195]|uniref:hypothetical protein n=1 Tax=Lysinibacillus sp. NPDC097195 TaxID=3364141 RepID=UPI00382C9B6B